LAIIFGLLATTALVLLFINDDAIKEITLRTNSAQKTRVTVFAVKKLVVKACSEIEGVKCKGIKLTTSDYGVKLKVKIAVKEKDVEQVEAYVRNMIKDIFANALGFAFSAIEIEIMKFEPAYKPNVAAIIAKADEELATKKEEETAEEPKEEEVEDAPVEEAAVVEEVASVEEETTVEEVAEEIPAVEETPVVEETEAVETLEAEVEEPKDEE